MQKHPDYNENFRKLLEPGTTNKRLESFLSNNIEDETSGVIIPPLQDKECALCSITDYPFSTDENIFVETDDYFVVECATKKGHETRNMVVFKDHSYLPSTEEISNNESGKAFRDLLNYSNTGNEEQLVVYGSMNTFNHPHFICSNLNPEGDEAKLSEVNNYIVFEDPYDISEPVAEHYGDEVGEAFLKRFYESAQNI